jgi:Mg2+-importing ATPase
MMIGISIPQSPLSSALGFTELPGLYWPLLVLTLLSYMVLTQGVKTVLLRKGWL